MKTRTYKGHAIERLFPSGYYSVFIVGVGYLRADTLPGLKQMIRDVK